MIPRRARGEADDRPAPARAIYWKQGCAGLVVLGLLLGSTLICALGITRGLLSPRWFDQSLGPVRLVGYSTFNAQCPPYTGCAPTRNESYVVWLIWQPTGQTQGTYQLGSVHLR